MNQFMVGIDSDSSKCSSRGHHFFVSVFSSMEPCVTLFFFFFNLVFIGFFWFRFSLFYFVLFRDRAPLAFVSFFFICFNFNFVLRCVNLCICLR